MSSRKLWRNTISIIVAAILVWTLIFYSNPVLKNVLLEIHLIFIVTTVGYFLVRINLPNQLLDLFKIFIRTLFRVWLFIFITFALSMSMDRIGILLSITYILGYIEGLIDLDRWIENQKYFSWLLKPVEKAQPINMALGSIFLMSLIHIFCACILYVFFQLYK